ncbi:MAG: hypothetical protein JXB46_01585, partial [Candidatus Eisenbacteria bacterium]|nr:hypothetical protein [Candidatus Eisenbacteria bacterium]
MIYTLVVVLIVGGYSAVLRVVNGLDWPTSVWQAVLCALAAGPILLVIIGTMSISKRLARYSIAVYRAVSPLMLVYQYAFPWVSWSLLIWWMNGDRLPRGAAWHSGAAITVFSYVCGAV